MHPSVLIPGPPAVYGNYQAALEAAGARAVFSPGGEAPDCDGLLLPGGGDLDPQRYGQSLQGSHAPDMERDARELALLARFAASGRPVLGICRGLQVINVFFGGSLYQDVAGHSQISGIDRLHCVSTRPGSVLFFLYGPEALVNSAHHQAVCRLGDGLTADQWSGDGLAEALSHQTLPIWAVQWHPERLRGAWARPEAADGQRMFDAFVRTLR